MAEPRFRTGLQRRLTGWVWLLLLVLPLAQGLALRHGVAHLGAASSPAALTAPAFDDDGSPGVPRAAHCALCLTLAAADAMAPTTPVALPLLARLSHAAPGTALPVGVAAGPAAAYRSRAPPLPTL